MAIFIRRDVTQESIGTVTAEIDWKRKIVTLHGKDGRALDPREVETMKRFLAYHHPDIVNRHGLATGWAITGEIDVPFDDLPAGARS
jgi:hypothetical protein